MDEHCKDWLFSNTCSHVQNMPARMTTVALKLEEEVLVKIQTYTPIKDLLEQVDKACKDGRIQDAYGFDVTAHLALVHQHLGLQHAWFTLHDCELF